jgi:hypothetical protein
LNKRELTSKIAKWAIELSMYDIVYKPRKAIKDQVLSDFMAEWIEIQTPPKEMELEYWTINIDGSLQHQGAGAGILVTLPKGEISSMSCKCIFLHLTMQPSMKLYFMV